MSVGVNSGSTKSLKTPIAGNLVVSNEIVSDFKYHYVTLTFYSDANCTVIVPKSTMAGTATFSGTINGTEYGVMQVGSDGDGVLTLGGANELSGEMSGRYKFARVNLNITDANGATHAILIVNSYKA